MNITMNNRKRHFPSLTLRFGYYTEDTTWENATLSRYSNCYTYALNLPDSHCYNPGQLMGRKQAHLENRDLIKSAMHLSLINDGLKPITSYEALTGKFHAVACRLRPHAPSTQKADYHLLRFDHLEGTWSHQRGTRRPGWGADPNPPSNADDNGKFITNPERGKFKNHPQFLGYYAIPKDGILYAPI